MFLSLHVTCSCIRTFISIYSYILICLVLFCVSLFLPFSLFILVSCIMALKWKSTPSQNPLHSGASSSSEPTPFHVRFRDEKARKDFLKNFSRRGIHSEHQVILSDFFDIDLPTVIYSRGWESLSGISSHALPWSYSSFTRACMDLITLYPSLSLAFGVYAL